MLIQIHMIQNHSPGNLNRDDLGAPKTCYFGGVLRSRISSQCIKRSIRMSSEFETLLGGVRTRQLARHLAEALGETDKTRKKAEAVLTECGFKTKKSSKSEEDDDTREGDNSKALVYLSKASIQELASILKRDMEKKPKDSAKDFARVIAEGVVAPDMALSGRMLEPDKAASSYWKSWIRMLKPPYKSPTPFLPMRRARKSITLSRRMT